MARHAVIRIVAFLLLSTLLICFGWYAHGWYDSSYGNYKDRRVTLKGFQYVSPLLDVELPEGYTVQHKPISFRHKISKFVDQQITSGDVRDVSVFYRDLLDGPWFGVNEQVKYNAASMMKLPVMLIWLKRAEKDPTVLQRSLLFDEKSYNGPVQNIKPEQTLTNGTSYAVDELLRYMVQFSDNRAMWLLYKELTDAEIGDALDSMDVTNDPSSGNNEITVHDYSGFLRILYNASYLNKEMSEKALKLMSVQEFNSGIAAGIPKGTKLASKFGEYADISKPDTVQLHEFGIVYHPNGPYILGVLTRGNNYDKQANVIKSVSEMVYNSVSMTINK